jgi:hypothetical protein
MSQTNTPQHNSNAGLQGPGSRSFHHNPSMTANITQFSLNLNSATQGGYSQSNQNNSYKDRANNSYIETPSTTKKKSTKNFDYLEGKNISNTTNFLGGFSNNNANPVTHTYGTTGSNNTGQGSGTHPTSFQGGLHHISNIYNTTPSNNNPLNGYNHNPTKKGHTLKLESNNSTTISKYFCSLKNQTL